MSSRHGSILDQCVEAGKIDASDIPRIVAHQTLGDITAEQALIDLGLISERDLCEIKAARLRTAFCEVEELAPDPLVVTTVPEDLAMGRAVLAIDRTDSELTIVVPDPKDVHLIDEVKRHTRLRLRVLMGSRGAIIKKLAEYRDHYKAEAVRRLLMTVADHGVELSLRMGLQVGDISEGTDQSAVVKLVNNILLKGLTKRASDIHLLPGPRYLLVKYRVDGKLVPGQTIPASLAPNVVSRLKILARLDISERRTPQDGAFHVSLSGREIDFRVATSPTIHGEKVVMRILDRQVLLLGLDNLGLSPDNLLKIRRNIRRPNGIILMVGPTGSGKTTTLYSALLAVHSDTKNITTIEDPVEYQIDGVTQIQVNPDIGLTFATLLRSILRQDPDVILVGEIRDLETAHIAIRAALTGHLVLATMHTNDAVSAITRLLDMGIEPYRIASSVRCVVGQRLVRTICPRCREPSDTDRVLLDALPEAYGSFESTWRGAGCRHCFNTGYRGRTAISEVLEWSEAIRRKVIERAGSAEIARVAMEEGMVPLFQDGLAKARAGVSTLEEVLSVCDEGMSVFDQVLAGG